LTLRTRSPEPKPYTLYPAPYTLHPTPYTLHPILYTLNPTPYILNPTPYIPNPEPYREDAKIMLDIKFHEYDKPTPIQAPALSPAP